MPLTCGRTSATRKALVRPGSSRVRPTVSDFSVTTVTSPGPCSGASGWPPQAATVAAMASDSAMGRIRLSNMTERLLGEGISKRSDTG
ncbi:hypothetical protein WR25_05507 [Diploscapter pachys]|uniref:Uncharacterized protein n=1 Tax=Diploscapter pachys TaxID=2018661 RepID=A0A2A2M629_9BILA|nr:hypothetical protein WR25_05507 [Diploscapter pachys]